LKLRSNHIDQVGLWAQVNSCLPEQGHRQQVQGMNRGYAAELRETVQTPASVVRASTSTTCGLWVWTALVLLLVLLVTCSEAFNNGNNNVNNNPFFSPAERFSVKNADIKAIKAAANAMLPDPIPGEPLPGLSLLRRLANTNCTVGTVHDINHKEVFPAISKLVQTQFFKYFKVSLASECPYWAMNRICTSGGGCTVCQCEEKDVPLFVRDSDIGDGKAVFKPLPLDFEKWDDTQDGDVWSQTQIEYKDPDATYINLLENPESNTGYSGAEPRMIWDAIYKENCFKRVGSGNVTEMCREEQIFYGLISGLHTSITVHVFARWKRDAETDQWRGNQGLWNQVFGRFPERLENLYFTLAFLLRALQRLEPELRRHPFGGNALAGSKTKEYMDQLLDAALKLNCQEGILGVQSPAPAFAENPTAAALTMSTESSESKGSEVEEQEDPNIRPRSPDFAALSLFTGPDGKRQKIELRNMFRNVSMIMNCVSCEKCRVWGKLNTLGLGTALKVMSAVSPEELTQIWQNLQRNELVAFINTIGSFSESVQLVSEFSILDYTPEGAVPAAANGTAVKKDEL